jgi:hypothetical protein
MIVMLVSGLALATLPGCATGAGSDAIARNAGTPTNTRPEAPEPEHVVREFMIALAKGDRAGMLAHMDPNADVDVLLQFRNPEDEAELVELFRTLPITRLKTGDQLADPFVPGQRIIPGMINEDHLVLNMHTKGKAAWTYFLFREEGRWRVNMDWMIEWLNRPGSRPRIVPGPPPRIVV